MHLAIKLDVQVFSLDGIGEDERLRLEAAIFIKPLPFIEVDVEALDQAVRAGTPDRKLTGSG